MPERNGLITTAELAAILDQPDLRLFDGTTYLEYQSAGSDIPYIAVPGGHTFEAAHIPGADFLDLQGEFSDPNTTLRFMMPAIARLEAAFGGHGIGANSRVVLYSIGTAMWATRFWWMLNSLGFENVSVLDGGLDKWKAESRAIETGPAKGYPPATFTAKPQHGYFVDKHQVLAAVGEHNTVVVNALGPQLHKGLEPSRYGRPGHSERQARHRLLRRRHLCHHRLIPAAPARLRQSQPLRRLDGRVGQGCIATDRDRLRQAAACHQAGTLGSGTTFGPEASGLFTR